MILKIVEGFSSKDTFHVAKTAVNLSIFSKLPFFNYNFLKLPQKLKKPSYMMGLRHMWPNILKGMVPPKA